MTRNNFSLINLNARVAGGAVDEYGAGSSETIGVLVEDNRAFILNELDTRTLLASNPDL